VRRTKQLHDELDQLRARRSDLIVRKSQLHRDLAAAEGEKKKDRAHERLLKLILEELHKLNAALAGPKEGA
jgi:hypothetical protein